MRVCVVTRDLRFAFNLQDRRACVDWPAGPASDAVLVDAGAGDVPHPLDRDVAGLLKDLEEADVQTRRGEHRHLMPTDGARADRV